MSLLLAQTLPPAAAGVAAARRRGANRTARLLPTAARCPSTSPPPWSTPRNARRRGQNTLVRAMSLRRQRKAHWSDVGTAPRLVLTLPELAASTSARPWRRWRRRGAASWPGPRRLELVVRRSCAARQLGRCGRAVWAAAPRVQVCALRWDGLLSRGHASRARAARLAGARARARARRPRAQRSTLSSRAAARRRARALPLCVVASRAVVRVAHDERVRAEVVGREALQRREALAHRIIDLCRPQTSERCLSAALRPRAAGVLDARGLQLRGGGLREARDDLAALVGERGLCWPDREREASTASARRPVER